MSTDDKPKGQPLASDPAASSASPTEPAFIARPVGAPVYHGFQILEDVCVEGFTFGKITDFELEECDHGDAFVVAPDGSRAGLVWELAKEEYFEQVLPPEPTRWGVWAVSFRSPMKTRDDARRNLVSIVHALRSQWEQWAKSRW